ncbi:NAD(P)-binding domain-containing protein [Shimia sp.]|uniref:NAD(P)-binding domain-containing protein n=1 Tax=Shimia sp. TaxID=1954381 RepID=UPI003299A2FA
MARRPFCLDPRSPRGMSRIGFIGTGHIAAPMVRFLAARGHEIRVTRRSQAVSSALAADHGAIVADTQIVLDGSDIIFLCLRPHQINDVLPSLTFRADHKIVSVMAGIASDTLATLCAPASDFVQTIPLGFLEIGGCPLAAFGNTTVLEALFAPENPVVPVASETALNAHFAICAMVPGLLDMMQTGANWLGDHTQDPAAADFFTTQLVSGFLSAMDRDHGALARERDALATDGTISLQMTQTLRTQGAHDALHSALNAIGKRLDPSS